MDLTSYGIAMALLHLLIQLVFIVRVLIRPHRQPASRIAWIVVILALPFLGILAYILFGEVNIGRKRIEKLHTILKSLPEFPDALQENQEEHY